MEPGVPVQRSRLDGGVERVVHCANGRAGDPALPICAYSGSQSHALSFQAQPQSHGKAGGDGSCCYLQVAGLECPQDGCRRLLDALARRLDSGDGLATTTGPGCDVAQRVVAGIDSDRLADDVCHGLSLKLGKCMRLELLVEKGVSDLVSQGLDLLGG